MNKERSTLLNQLVRQIGSFSRHMHMRHPICFGEIPLSKPHIMILFSIVHHKDGVSVKHVAEVLGVTPGAVTQFVDVLVEKNLVKRGEDISDRRKQKLLLTTFASENFAKFKKDYYASMSALFAQLNDEELKQFVTLLEKVTAADISKNC